MEKKINIPKKGAAQKWAKRLKELGQKKPAKDLVNKINQAEDNKRSAMSNKILKDLDLKCRFLGPLGEFIEPNSFGRNFNIILSY